MRLRNSDSQATSSSGSRAFDAVDILEHLARRRTTEIQQFVVRVDCCQWCQGNIGELGRNNTLEDARSIDG